MGKNDFLPVKSDILFRLFFADERNEEFLVSLLKSVLKLPEDDYNEIEIADPYLLREFDGDKLGILDVKLYTRTRKVIHIEIQLKVTPELKNRIIFYDAKLITEQIGSGQDYDTIQKVVSIIITDEELIKGSSKYHHCFTFYDPGADVEFSDVIEIHSLELRKLPEGTDGSALYNWARFIAAESDEELDKVAEMDQEVKEAVIKYRELTADERTRNMIERQEMLRMDIAVEKRWAIKQREFDIARNMIADGESTEKIMKYTGLTRDEVESLK